MITNSRMCSLSESNSGTSTLEVIGGASRNFERMKEQKRLLDMFKREEKFTLSNGMILDSPVYVCPTRYYYFAAGLARYKEDRYGIDTISPMSFYPLIEMIAEKELSMGPSKGEVGKRFYILTDIEFTVSNDRVNLVEVGLRDDRYGRNEFLYSVRTNIGDVMVMESNGLVGVFEMVSFDGEKSKVNNYSIDDQMVKYHQDRNQLVKKELSSFLLDELASVVSLYDNYRLPFLAELKSMSYIVFTEVNWIGEYIKKSFRKHSSRDRLSSKDVTYSKEEIGLYIDSYSSKCVNGTTVNDSHVYRMEESLEEGVKLVRRIMDEQE